MTATSEDFDQDVVDPNNLEKTGSQNLLGSDDEEMATLEHVAVDLDDRLSGEIEELLTLLGLSQSMIQVTNEMITPPMADGKLIKDIELSSILVELDSHAMEIHVLLL